MSRPETFTEIIAAWARYPIFYPASYGQAGSISRALAARRRAASAGPR